MFFSFLFVTSQAFSFTITENLNASNDVTWVLGHSSKWSQLDPAGEDFRGTLYVARSRVSGQWIPGKGFYSGETFYSVVSYGGREILTTDNQALVGGNARWVVPNKNSKLPSSAIIAGYDPLSGQPEYVCRGYVTEGRRSWLIVGKHVDYIAACLVGYYGEAYINAFEILVESCCGPE